MKCLTVCQPYAAALIHGPKRVENRTWYCRHVGLLAIHAGKSRDWLETLTDAELESWPEYDEYGLEFGKIIGVTFVFKCERYGDSDSPDPWKSGPFCIYTRDPVALPAPIPFRGQQGLFDIDDALIAEQLPDLRDPCSPHDSRWYSNWRAVQPRRKKAAI